MQMEKKTVWITGADRGVGFSLCEEFLRGGWHVFAGRFMPEWTALDTLKEKYPEALEILPLDVGSDDSVRAAAKATAARCGHVDLLVSCAGSAGGDDPEKTRAI